MSDKYELSRRKALAALGTIGVAGAGAGMGTSALFSDEEEFTNNEIEAGTLNLVVDYATSYDFSDPEGDDSGEIDGNPSDYSYVLSDVKPGDSGVLAFCPKIVDNPGWLFVGSDSGITNYENGQTEPEEDVDPSGGGNLGGSNDGDPNGELGEEIVADLIYASSISSGDPVTWTEIETIMEGQTLNSLFAALEKGFLVDGDPADGADEDGEPDAFPASDDADTQNGPCLVVDWELPADVGNEIQSDALEADFTFAAYQSRNNPDPTDDNPFVDVIVNTESELRNAAGSTSAGDVIAVASDLTLSGSKLEGLSGRTLTSVRGGSSPTVTVESRLEVEPGATICRLDFDLTNGGTLYANEADYFQFLDNSVSISGSSNYGLRLENADKAVVANNTFDQDDVTSGTPQGVLVAGTTDAAVRNNVINGPSGQLGQGILVTDDGISASNVEIVDNDIDSWEEGVFLFEFDGNGIANVSIVGNEITSSADYDIEALDDTGSDGFENINGEDAQSAQKTALLNDNNVSSVLVSD